MLNFYGFLRRILSMPKSDKKMKILPSYNRLASRYLIFSLIAALSPIIVLSALYDNFFVNLENKISDHQNTAQVITYENATRNFLQERELELDDLVDQFDHHRFFQEGPPQPFGLELDSILRVLVDTPYTYGVAFFNKQGKIIRTFPSQMNLELELEGLHSSNVKKMDVIGPSVPAIDLPRWFVLKRTFSDTDQRGIGLILRFATMTTFMRPLVIPGIRKPTLQTPRGVYSDSVGLVLPKQDPGKLQLASEIIPGWKLFLSNDSVNVAPPISQIRFFLLFAAIISALVILYLHYDVSFRLNRQIDKLISRVERVAQGGIDTPLKITGSWEIKRLSGAIESMRNQLQSFIRSSLEMERRASLGQLAAGVAHEIRNPLATINTTIDALYRIENNPEKKELMEIISDEIERTNMVITDMLNFARPREPEPQELIIDEIFNSVRFLVEASAEKQGNIFKISPCSKEITTWCDAIHLRQILMNLLLNGLQAMEGKPKGVLHLFAYQKNENCVITVTDQGCGIPPEKIKRITEPFFTTKASGTGLGLAICSGLITKNGGKLIINSTFKQGTEVTITIPVGPSLTEVNNNTRG